MDDKQNPFDGTPFYETLRRFAEIGNALLFADMSLGEIDRAIKKERRRAKYQRRYARGGKI